MKHAKRLTSLLLACVMALGMALPSAAATQYGVSITVDDTTRWTDGYNSGSNQTLTLMELGARDVGGVTIKSEGDQDTYGPADYDGASDTLANGTGYRFYTTTDSNGIATFYCQITSLNADVEILVATDKTSYAIRANSGPYGSNSNQGVSGNETCSISGSADQTVTGGNSWDIEFVPKSGYDINYLNIRPDYNNNNLGKVVSAPAAGSKSTVTIAGKPYVISKASNGTVTLHCEEATRDIYATALTEAAKTTYSLTVSTDGHSTSDITSTTLTEGTTKTVTLSTTASGYNIGEIRIVDGSSQGTIKYNDTAVTVNGHNYTVTRKLDGSAVLSVPAIKENVTITAASTNETHYVSVNEGRYTDSDQDGVQFFRPTDSYAVTFEPDTDTIIDEVVIRTSRGTYSADVTDSYIVVEGVYYRMYNDNNGDITVYLTQVPTNMEISVKANSTVHKVTLKTNTGADTAKSSYNVDDGDNLDAVFTTTSSKYDITELRIVYDGTSYKADPRDDSYVRVNGTKWPISVDNDGTVTLSMKDIEYDVTVTASTNRTSSGRYSITKSADTHSNITYTGTSPFDEDDTTTIRVYTDKNYIIDSVKFTMNGKTATVEPFDSYFKLDGNTYYVNWEASDEFTVKFTDFTGSLKITANAVKGDVTTQTPVWSASSYHQAYMVGYGNGYFGPSTTLTRAEAVTVLTRAISNVDPARYNYYGSYLDVDSTAWYASYVNYANQMGYLKVLGNGSYFYPLQPITRAEYIALMCAFSGANVSNMDGKTNFSDVPTTHWAAKYIDYAATQGWVSGVGGGYCQPDRTIQRAEICTMMNRIMNRTADRTRAYGAQFIDVPVTHWAYYEIMEAANSHYAYTDNNNGELWG